MTADDDGFETAFGGDGGEETRVAFADGEARLEGGEWGRRLDGVVEEGDDVIGDVVVEPGEDAAGFVG